MSVTNPRQTFINPVIPFAGTILGGLLPGEMVLIQGSVLPKADRFQVDLTCGSSVKPRADIAFHFNPRFSRSGCIVCNSLQGERWGREEILHHNPLTAGGAFELVLLVQTDHYKVAVNGAHLLEYKHRVELQRVDTLCISGKVKVEAVGVVPSAVSSSPAAELSLNAQTTNIVSSAGDLSVPFRAELISGLSVGRSITVKGRMKEDAQSFCVNLCSGSDLALHLNPRLSQCVLVCNSLLSGCWGPEETTTDGFPFRAGQYFEVIVLCEPHQFRVAANGQHQLDYKHRVQDVSRIRRLEVEGDVLLLSVKMH